jgi:hypothetical protein
MSAMAVRLWLVGLGVVLSAAMAGAEPYMAVREGFRCSGCHVNQTGGGKRNELMVAHARDVLHYPKLELLDWLSAPAEVFTGELNRYVGLGANLRVSNTATFQEQPDANGRVKNNTAFRGRLEENELDVNEAVAFLEVRLIPERLTFYVDQRFAPVTDTREAWGLLRLPWEVWVKAGRMFLPYGLQLQDDTAFIRGGRNGSVTTDFSFEQQQPAAAVGWERGPFSVIAAVSEGAPRDRDVRVTGTAMALFTDLPVVRNLLVGGSATRVGPPDVQSVVFGFFAGTNLERATLLTEIDFRSDDTPATGGRAQGTFIQYSELNYLLFDWLNAKVAFQYADDDGDLSSRTNDSEHGVLVGIEPFWNRFLQTRLFYRVYNGIASEPAHNQDLLTLELHTFF